MKDPEPYIDSAAARRWLGCSQDTLRTNGNERGLEYHIVPGTLRTRRYRLSELEAWMARVARPQPIEPQKPTGASKPKRKGQSLLSAALAAIEAR